MDDPLLDLKDEAHVDFRAEWIFLSPPAPPGVGRGRRIAWRSTTIGIELGIKPQNAKTQKDGGFHTRPYGLCRDASDE